MERPTQEDIQYTREMIQGKRKPSVIILICFAIVGAILGAVIGVSGSQANNEPLDFGAMASSVAFVALCFFFITWLVLFAFNSLKAICKAWLPGLLIVVVAGSYILYRAIRYLWFGIMMGSLAPVGYVILTAAGLVFAFICLNVGVRLVFYVYCMVSGKDSDEVLRQATSAGEDGRPQNPAE